jgi:hypothetical protein
MKTTEVMRGWMGPLLGAVLMVFSSSAHAQPTDCFVPDGLDGGPCCTTTQATLPRFPDTDTVSKSICWRNP